MGFGKSEGPTCVLGPNLKHYVYINDPVFLYEPLVTPGAMILLDEGIAIASKFIYVTMHLEINHKTNLPNV